MNAKLLRRLAAVALLVAGLMAIWNVKNADGINCGSWISPNTAAAGIADAKNNTSSAQRGLEDAMIRSGGDLKATGTSNSSSTAQVDSCRESRSSRTMMVVVTAVTGFALLGFAMTRPASRVDDPGAASSG
jgi:hypothetical protein